MADQPTIRTNRVFKSLHKPLTRDFLNPAQRAAIEEILTIRDRIHGLHGLAGTGKTTTLEAIREGAERNGYPKRDAPDV